MIHFRSPGPAFAMAPPLALALTLASLSPAVFAQSAPVPTPLNDTGSTLCRSAKNVFSNRCAGTGQDGAYGRDVTNNDPSDGLAGFSFTKLDAAGAPLPAGATAWACVLDNVTGLMWENKTTDGGLHDTNKTFINIGKNISGDVSNWVLQVNAQGLCGFHDWRLPTVMEQQSIYDYGLPAASTSIDTSYFANPVDKSYWSSQPYIGTTAEIFGSYSTVGDIEIYGNADSIAARLVRSVNPPPNPADNPRFILNGLEATDTYTGLVWRRCAEGQTWNGVTCSGTALRPAKYFSFQAALAQAASQSASTGQAWRVPNIKELASIANYAFKSPALDHAVFPNNLAPFYMSSTPPTREPTYNWLFDAGAGTIEALDPAESAALRLVRNAP